MSFERSGVAPTTAETQEGFWHKVDRELDLLGVGFKAIPAAAKEELTKHPIETGLKVGAAVGLGVAFGYFTHSSAPVPWIVQTLGIGVGVASIGSGLGATGSALIDNWHSANRWQQNVDVMQHNFAPFAFDTGLTLAGSLAGGLAGRKLSARFPLSEPAWLSQSTSDRGMFRPSYEPALGSSASDTVEPVVRDSAQMRVKPVVESLNAGATPALPEAAVTPKGPPPYELRKLGWRGFDQLDWVDGMKRKYPEMQTIASNASAYTKFDHETPLHALLDRAAPADVPFIQEYFRGKLGLEELSCQLSGAGAGLCDKRAAFTQIVDLLGKKLG